MKEAAVKELINYSEFQTLASCERKFAYGYVLGMEETGAKRGLHLGTLIHLWHSRWLMGLGATLPSEWTDDINTGGKPGDVRTLSLADFEPELVTRSMWLAGRFVECYGEAPPSSWTVISAEEWMTRAFTWGTLVGRTDGFVEINGNLWLIEVKSFGARPGPLAYAQVSPQLGCYSLLAEEKYGQRPWGVLYQGVYTKQWKPTVPTQAALIERYANSQLAGPYGDQNKLSDLTKADQRAWAKAKQADESLWTQRPAGESFTQLEVELGEEHLVTAEWYLDAAVKRRKVLRAYQDTVILERAVPNIGRDCSWCGFKNTCWHDLGGVEEYEIELEDSDAVPV